MSKNKLNITDALLVKYLQGELQESEQVSVAHAISVQGDVRKQFERLQQIWNECSKIGVKSTVNVDEAWQRFKQGIATSENNNRIIALPAYNKWLRVAAVLLLFVGIAGVNYYKVNRHKDQAIGKRYVSATAAQKTAASSYIATVGNSKLPAENTGKVKKTNIPAVKSRKGPGKEMSVYEKDGNKATVCNSTSSPMEICIIQQLKCPDGQLSIISTCSKLQPDEANSLRYKHFDKNAGSCKAIVDEITIKKVTTGEMMVFNADSKPVTAGELFSYISGQKKGDVLAGSFDADCLAFDSKSGDFVLQQCPPGGNNEHCY